MGWTSDVGGEVVNDKPGKESSLELRKLWMPSSAMWTLCGRHWASLGVGGARISQHDLPNQLLFKVICHQREG